MSRKIKILYKVPQHRLMRCVYKITFGGKFYIGRSTLLAQRIAAHETGINTALRGYAKHINSGASIYSVPGKSSMYMRLAKYLLENPQIKHGVVEVITRGITEDDLYVNELPILRNLIGNPDCLNVSFTTGRSKNSGSDELWMVKRKRKEKDELYYYSSKYPKTLFNSKTQFYRIVKT